MQNVKCSSVVAERLTHRLFSLQPKIHFRIYIIVELWVPWSETIVILDMRNVSLCNKHSRSPQFLSTNLCVAFFCHKLLLLLVLNSHFLSLKAVCSWFVIKCLLSSFSGWSKRRVFCLNGPIYCHRNDSIQPAAKFNLPLTISTLPAVDRYWPRRPAIGPRLLASATWRHFKSICAMYLFHQLLHNCYTYTHRVFVRVSTESSSDLKSLLLISGCSRFPLMRLFRLLTKSHAHESVSTVIDCDLLPWKPGCIDLRMRSADEETKWQLHKLVDGLDLGENHRGKVSDSCEVLNRSAQVDF